MSGRSRRNSARGNLWFGVALMLFGFVFLADRMELIDLGRIGTWWPLIPVVFGVAKILGWQSADAVGSGVTWTLMGFWFLASVEGWYGLTWRNSWPLALAAIGTGMVVKAVLGPLFAPEESGTSEEKEKSHVG